MNQNALNYIKNQITDAKYILEGHIKDANGTFYRPRNIFIKIQKYINDFLINSDSERWIIMPGLRGVGKTTILAQTYSQLVKSTDNRYLLYISMDEAYGTLGLSLKDILETYEYFLGEKFGEQKHKIFIFIDEVQADKNWSQTIKTLLYNKTKNIFIITTGSSAVSLQIDADVSRRAVFEKLYPMNFCELELIKNNIYPENGLEEKIKNALYYSDSAEEAYRKITKQNKPISDYFSKITVTEIEKYITLENLPFTVNREKNKTYEKIRLLIDKVINADIRDLAKFDIDTLGSIKRLLFILADSLDAPSVNTLTSTTGIKRLTMMNVLEVLEKAELLIKVSPYGSNLTKSKKPSKYLFMSPTYRMSLLSITGDKSTYLTRQGKLMEDVVSAYLFRDFVSPGKGSISYDPSEGGADFILEIENQRKIILEVGRGEKNNKQIHKTSEKIKSAYGIIISYTNDVIEVKDNILKIPFKLFLIS